MYEYDFSAVYDKLQDADYRQIAEYYKEAFRRFPEWHCTLWMGMAWLG